MTWSEIQWGAWHWRVPVIVILMAFAGLVAWCYRSSELNQKWHWLAAALKIFAIFLLGLCLLEPLASGMRPRSGANTIAVLVDNSRSMRIANRNLPEIDEIQGWIASEDKSWRRRLEQDFDVRLYTFDQELRRIETEKSLTFDGQQSNFHESLERLRTRLANRPVAGILVISDGNATDRPSERSKVNGPPVYTLLPESRSAPRDIRLGDVVVSQTHFESSPTSLTANIYAEQFTGRKVKTQLLDQNEKIVETEVIEARAEKNAAPIRFRFRPTKPGTSFYQLRVTPIDNVDEAIEENNVRTVAIHRGGGPFRILYVAGRPNWEYKFIRRALDDDDEIQLVGLIRIADEEPKFRFQDRSGTDANPLFEGFDDKAKAETESYDEAVLVAIGVSDDDELGGGFPATEEKLFAFDAVIIDDLEASFFSPDQMLLLRRYVSQRGGSLMMLGGVSTFVQGGYNKTPVGDMLPVYLNPFEVVQPKAEEVRLTLTRDGMLEPWVRLRATEIDEQQRLEKLPGFKTLSQVGQIKPGAICLATGRNPQNDSPAIVSQRFGKGRVAAILVGDFWRVAMHRQREGRNDLAVFWRQTGRWLTADTPQRVELEADDKSQGSQSISLRVTVRNSVFRPDDDCTLQLTVTEPQGASTPLIVEPGNEAGVFTAEFWPSSSGGHLITAKVQASDGEILPVATKGFVWSPEEMEFAQLAVNVEALQQLSRETEGESLLVDDFMDISETLNRRAAPIMEPWVQPIWHRGWVFGLVVVSLCLEWGIRRWKGLV